MNFISISLKKYRIINQPTIMEKFKTTIKLLTSVILLSNLSFSQEKIQVKIDIDKPQFEDIETPDLVGANQTKRDNPKDWLEMEVKFEIKAMKPLPRDETLNELMVKWVVVAEDPTRKGKYIRLTREIKHVNIPVGEELYSSCYISPSGVRRLSGGGERASKNIIFGVGGEFYVGGELVGFFASEKATVKIGGVKKPFWYSSDLAESDSVQIYKKSDTPFQWFWYDRYAELETEANKAHKKE